MITIRINAKTREQTIISADDFLPPGRGIGGLAEIMADWIFEKNQKEQSDLQERRQVDV